MIMKVTSKQIAKWIEDYLKERGEDVHKREWQKKQEHHHAPFNNSDDCYHKWLDWVDENKERLMALPTFEDIISELEKKEMKGIGPLTRYDTATQLAFPDKKFPEKVHLNAGAAKGAKALGITGSAVDKQIFVDICPYFERMSTAQIEDFLCVYKSYLNGEIENGQETTPKACGKAKICKPRGCFLYGSGWAKPHKSNTDTTAIEIPAAWRDIF